MRKFHTSELARSLLSQVNPAPQTMVKRDKDQNRVWSPRSMVNTGDWPTIPSLVPAETAEASCRRWVMRPSTKKKVPVGFVACGIGATSIGESRLPEGTSFPNPPPIESRVEKQSNGTWVSNGADYDTLLARTKPLGPNGFRTVLWHPGESDTNHPDSSRTLPGSLYRQYLEQLFRDPRQDLGWEVSWFVALASYHDPRDEGSEDIRTAKSSLWRDGIALQGPDSDALKGTLRDGNGQGVHFSGPGPREHATKWAQQILPWLDRQSLAGTRVHGAKRFADWASIMASVTQYSVYWLSATTLE